MIRYTSRDIEALTNWDGLLCKRPWHNESEKRQYYSRYISRMLWRYFTEDDWQTVAPIIHELRVPKKLKITTQFLAERHLKRVSH
ncbi:hypothetical protein HYW94_01510 [Candidatus Uhrbacteria bacterium]|nr:hypothetical protein [Candidatus Uhrbacteria bacterium]